MSGNKTAIVTGATGFIGTALVNELLANGYDVWAVVRKESRLKINSSDKLHIVLCDMENMENLGNSISQGSAKYFFHLAWKGCSGDERFDTELQLKNVNWTIKACKVAKKLGCDRIIVAGSIMEKEAFAATFSPGNHPGLGYIYGGAKLVAHTMAMSVSASCGIDLIWGSITNAYGVGEISPRLVNSTLIKCLKNINPTFTSGIQNYDFVYIDDVVRAFRLIAEKGKAFTEYTISSGFPKQLKEFLLEMQAAVAPDLHFKFGEIPYTGINLPLSSFYDDRILKDTGFRALVDFAEGCRKTINWLNEEMSLRKLI